jgi:uncharacterized protein (DUF427 family)
MRPADQTHPIDLTTTRQRWRAKFAGHVIADSDDAIVLHEAGAPAMIYFPRGDVSTEYMSSSNSRSHCPYKGDASYLSILMDGDMVEDVAWSYLDPYPAMDLIAGRIAFYPDKVEIYAVDDATVNPRHHDQRPVNDVVRHTDSGGGRSQA